MLILAGVSLNAIIGDNGIITNAQNANVKSGMAVLEEWLQEKYVENYERMDSDKNKVAMLSYIYTDYFYDPRVDGYGTVNYVTDSEGHALYLINKGGLPSEIADGLVGGNCGSGKSGSERYLDYLTLKDVYGVTSELKVYYSAGDGIFTGISSSEELDHDTTSRVVLASSSALAKVIKEDGTDVTVADTQSVKSLVINKTSGVTSLSDLYILGSLENLTLENMTLDSLEGIQTASKLNYIYMKRMYS